MSSQVRNEICLLSPSTPASKVLQFFFDFWQICWCSKVYLVIAAKLYLQAAGAKIGSAEYEEEAAQL
jgi:hypothetical protein